MGNPDASKNPQFETISREAEAELNERYGRIDRSNQINENRATVKRNLATLSEGGVCKGAFDQLEYTAESGSNEEKQEAERRIALTRQGFEKLSQDKVLSPEEQEALYRLLAEQRVMNKKALSETRERISFHGGFASDRDALKDLEWGQTEVLKTINAFDSGIS